jgi:Ca-activated chloride channel family protein
MILVAFFAVCVVMRPRAAQEPVFRAGADAVVVPVAVRDGRGRPIGNLTADDFRLTDNGVRQTIASTSLESMPIDVTLLLDVSGSLQGAALARFKTDVQNTAAMLQPGDRVRLVAFADNVFDISGLQPKDAPLPLDRLEAQGRTAFCHALAAALTLIPDGDRPHVVLAFTDGIDTTSFLDGEEILTLAETAASSLYIALVPTRITLAGIGSRPNGSPRLMIGSASMPGDLPTAPSRSLLQRAAKATGGSLYVVLPEESLPTIFAKVLQEYRTGYVLRYAPHDVSSAGWHEIRVTLARTGTFDVHARKGYER